MKNRLVTKYIDLITLSERTRLVYEDKNNPFVICEFEVITDLEDNVIDSRFITMAAACELFWGYLPKEMIGRSYKDFEYSRNHQRSDNVINDNIEYGTPIAAYDNIYKHKDGSLINNRWYSSNPVNNRFTCICVRR